MDRARRLSRLEVRAEPQAAFLVWLREAQRFPSVSDYARAHVEAADPFGSVLQGVIEHAHRRLRGRADAEVVRATRRIGRESRVAYHLVIGLNLEAQRSLEMEHLRIAKGYSAGLRQATMRLPARRLPPRNDTSR